MSLYLNYSDRFNKDIYSIRLQSKLYGNMNIGEKLSQEYNLEIGCWIYVRYYTQNYGLGSSLSEENNYKL